MHAHFFNSKIMMCVHTWPEPQFITNFLPCMCVCTDIPEPANLRGPRPPDWWSEAEVRGWRWQVTGRGDEDRTADGELLWGALMCWGHKDGGKIYKHRHRHIHSSLIRLWRTDCKIKYWIQIFIDFISRVKYMYMGKTLGYDFEMSVKWSAGFKYFLVLLQESISLKSLLSLLSPG